jgi:hypothetical protein
VFFIPLSSFTPKGYNRKRKKSQVIKMKPKFESRPAPIYDSLKVTHIYLAMIFRIFFFAVLRFELRALHSNHASSPSLELNLAIFSGLVVGSKIFSGGAGQHRKSQPPAPPASPDHT